MDEQNQTPVPPQNTQSDYYPQQSSELPAPTPVLPNEVEPETRQIPSVEGGAPASASADAASAGSAEQLEQPLKPKRKKSLIIAAATAVLIVLLGAGAAFAYVFWYQNPQHVIMDGLGKALQAKTLTYTGSLNLSNPTDKLSVKLAIAGAAGGGNANLDVTATISQQDQQYPLHGNGVFDNKGNLYVRFQDVAKTIDSLIKNNPDIDLPKEAQPLVDKLVAKVDNRWIKISASDLKDYSSDGADTMTCINNARDALRSDQSVRRELTNLYQKNPFVHVDENLGIKDGSLGYVVSPDEAKLKTFVSGLKNTAIYKKIHDCDNNFEINQDDFTTDDIKNQRVEIWLSQWQHEITRASVNQEDKDGTKTELSWLPTFDKEVDIKIPNDTTTLSELQADIQDIFTQYMMSQMSGASSMTPAGQKL